MTLERLGEELIATVHVGPWHISFDLLAVVVSVCITVVLVALGLWLRRGLPRDPEAPLSRKAGFVAALLELSRTQLVAGFDETLSRKLLPLVTTLFFYILLCNWVGLLPFPYVVSPTQNLNVPISLAILVYVLAHYYGLKTRGVRPHLRSYLEPTPMLLPMNLVGDLGRTLSHGFRLFGNILGGAILTTLVPVLLARVIWLLPFAFPLGILVDGFFGLFVGTIQALVFALLASAYINLAVSG
ncbi:MAG: F0F1 ATP synthase subunit A [Candidatus Bipolaricaulota bacterium]